MATRKIPKPVQNKLAKAAETLNTFTGAGAQLQGNDIILNGLYLVDDSNNPITLSLLYNNIGIAASTDITFDGKDVTKKDSIKNFPVDTNAKVAGKFLKIVSGFMATANTPVPDTLKVEFVISGGKEKVSFPISVPPSDLKLKTKSDQGSIDISIFFLKV